jgi:hypothetical protein
MRKGHIVIALFLLVIFAGGAQAIGSFKAALVWYTTASTWNAATGGSSAATRGIRWDTANDVPIAHQNSGTELSMVLPNQTSQSGKFLTTNGTTAAWASAGGGTELFWDQAGYVANNSPLLGASNASVGIEITFDASVTATGIKTFWQGSSAVTLKASVWAVSGGIRLASGTLAVTSSGSYTIPFSSTAMLTPFALYVFSVYETTGTNFTYTNTLSNGIPNGVPGTAFVSGAHSVFIAKDLFNSGDAIPNTSAGVNIYPVTPQYTVP